MNDQEQTNVEYHADHASITKTMLTVFLKDGPQAYFRRFISHEDAAPARTKSLEVGDATHAAILEPQRYAEQVIEIPSWALSDSGRRAGKTWKAFAAEHPGKVLLKSSEVKMIRRMREVVMQKAGNLFTLPGMQVEKTIRWHDKETGLALKCRPDAYAVGGKMVVIPDLKTAVDAGQKAFDEAVGMFHYWLQAVHYSAGLEATYDKPALFVFVVVTNRLPLERIECNVYELTGERLENCRKKYRDALQELARCYESNVWPVKKAKEAVPVISGSGGFDDGDEW